MIFDFVFLTFLFFIVNKFFEKKNLLIDSYTLNLSTHKKFVLNKKASPVISGGLLFVITIIYYLLKDNNLNFFLLYSMLFFLIGIFSDLKKIEKPIIRFLFQTILILLFLLSDKNLEVSTEFVFFDNLLKNNFFNFFFLTFCFLTLINGCNFIDGTNLVSSINFGIILFFINLTFIDFNITVYRDIINLFILSIVIFIPFNFMNKSFLGDSGAYLMGFILGILAIKLYMVSESVSPYYIFSLLWYPVFENLFSIIRRIITNKRKHKPDNDHLHHLIFNFFKKKYNHLISSNLTGIIINLLFLPSYILSYLYYNNTKILAVILFFNFILYIMIYLSLRKKAKNFKI